jgi:hypothetical protein
VRSNPNVVSIFNLWDIERNRRVAKILSVTVRLFHQRDRYLVQQDRRPGFGRQTPAHKEVLAGWKSAWIGLAPSGFCASRASSSSSAGDAPGQSRLRYDRAARAPKAPWGRAPGRVGGSDWTWNARGRGRISEAPAFCGGRPWNSCRSGERYGWSDQMPASTRSRSQCPIFVAPNRI